MALVKRKILIIPVVVLILAALVYITSGMVLTFMGKWLIVDETPERCDAVVVLNTGLEYYPRLIEAANLYNQGLAGKIVINGNRKDDTLRELEEMGLEYCCPWFEEWVRILELYGVPREDVITISAEDAYDTISEAEAVGEEIIGEGMQDIIIVTSKSHTRRARHIWRNLWTDRLKVIMVSAKDDPYDPNGWWKSGRQIKWVLSEYGGWIYYHYLGLINERHID